MLPLEVCETDAVTHASQRLLEQMIKLMHGSPRKAV